MESLPGLWSLTPIGALLGFIVLLGYFLASGKLVTRREVEARIAAVEVGNQRVLTEKDARITELMDREGRLVTRGDDWKKAYDAEHQTNEALQRQLLPANLEVMRNFQHFIGSLPVPPNGARTGEVEA